MTDDSDLRSVREFQQDRSGLAPGSLDRVRRRVRTATAPYPPGRLLAPRWAAPAAAAAVVAVVAVGVAVLGATGGGTSQPGWPTAGPASSAPTEAEGTGALWLKYGAPVPVAVVFAELDQAAAATARAMPRAGQLLCSNTTVLMRSGPTPAPGSAPSSARVQVRCFEPEGLIELPAPGVGDVKGQSPDEQLAAARDGFAVAGPSWGYPTAAWLDALPADPDLLLVGFRAGSRGPAEVDDLTRWQQYGRFLTRVDPLLPAAQRAAFHRLMGRLDGLTAVEAFTVSGKRLLAVRLTSGTVGDELLFNPDTGRLAGHVELTVPGGGEPVPVRQELLGYHFQPAASWASPSAEARR